jgi:hypothetical protein
VSEGRENLPVKIPDTFPPESFTPLLGTTPEYGPAVRVLFFETQDKGSGMARYEVRESFGWGGSFEEATSPYVLKQQTGSPRIAVKAIDKVGNERVVEITPVYRNLWQWSAILPILIVVIILLYIIRKTMPKTI